MTALARDLHARVHAAELSPQSVIPPSSARSNCSSFSFRALWQLRQKKKQKPAHPWKSWLSVRCMSKGASGHIHRVPPMLQKCPERRSYCRIPNWTERRWPLWRVALTRLYQLGPTAACPPLTVRSRPSNLLTWPQNARLPPTTAYPCPNSLRRGLSASSKPTLPLRMLSLFDTFHWFSMVFMGNGKNWSGSIRSPWIWLH